MKVFWDTNLFIYWMEPSGDQSESVTDLELRMRQREDTLYTSAVTLGEMLVLARRNLDDLSAARLRGLLLQAATIVSFDIAAAEHYARIRARTDVRGPDAVQLACAAAVGAELFITNDDRLSRKVVPGVPILTSLVQVPI